MRLTQMIEVIDRNIPKLYLEVQGIGGSNDKVASNLLTLRRHIVEIARIPALQSQANNILAMIPFLDRDEEIRLSSTVTAQINGNVERLKTLATMLTGTLKSLEIPHDDETVYFRIPAASNLTSFAEDMNKVSKSLENILAIGNLTEPIKFRGFEKGSDWIVLGVGAIAMAKVLLIFKTAISLAEKNVRFEKSHLELKQAEADEEILSKNRQMISDAMDAFYRGEAKKVFEAFEKNPTDPSNAEAFNRVIHSIKNLQGLFARGASAEVPRLPHTPPENAELSAEIEETKKAIESTAKMLLRIGAPTDTV